MKTMRVDITDIDWDTDDGGDGGDNGAAADAADLPDEVMGAEVPYAEGDEPSDAVAEWLSDRYGFAVKGLSFTVRSWEGI